MDHDRAERLISERLDGEHLPGRAGLELERHLQGCGSCRAFERAAWRLRERARLEVAPAVPDLVEPIMAAARAQGVRRPGLRVLRPLPSRRRRTRIARLLPTVTTALVGALVGSVIVGGPWADRAPERSGALAAVDITRGVAQAAPGVQAYEARFAITEYHFSPEVPVRELSMHVWFRAPERFRMDVVDHTDYPGRATRTDLRLIVDGEAWYASAPSACPTAVCPERAISVRNRAPFSSAAPAPTDLVLPLTALARPEGVTVLERGTVLGRPAVRVELPFERAAPLFPFLSIGGEWRPFFRNDRVRIWLDERDWFPLRWQVFPAAGRERDAWALRFGLAEEPARRAIFEVDALSVEAGAPPPSVFAVPSGPGARDQGARTVAPEDLAREAGFQPLAPPTLDGLELYRAVIPAVDPAGAGRVLLTYAEGLSFVKLGQAGSWSGDAPFGPVDARAEEVTLGGGVAYYEPATLTQGRRLSIHASGIDLYVETNLPRERLLALAAGLPVTGLPMPEAWRVREADGATVERVTLEEASTASALPLELPTALPPGFRLASVELVRIGTVTGVDVYFREAEADVGTGSIRLHLEVGGKLPPATAARQSMVRIGGADGRWTPGRGRLEWVEDGVYRSLDAPGLGLGELLAVASSIPGTR